MRALPTPPAIPTTNLDGALARIRRQVEQRPGVFDRDAALPFARPIPYGQADQTWDAVRSAWYQQVVSERLQDYTVDRWQDLGVDPRDGALTRGKGGLAYTPHAWQQLIGLLKQGLGTPNGLTKSLAWESPHARAFGFDDLRSRSGRKATDELHFRTFVDPATGLRALRACPSGRHSMTHFDDLALMDCLQAIAETLRLAHVYRSVDETVGWALLGHSEAMVQRSLHWRNSETGCGRLSFGAGIALRFLDSAVIRDPRGGDGVDTEIADVQTVTLADASTRTARNHTLPRFSTGSGERLTENARAAIARRRMTDDRDNAVAQSSALTARWETALTEFAPGFNRSLSADKLGISILLDTLEERGVMLGSDRAGLESVLTDETRLTQVPHGSAAHVACAYAVLAKRSASYDEATRLQKVAGAWLMLGWAAGKR